MGALEVGGLFAASGLVAASGLIYARVHARRAAHQERQRDTERAASLRSDRLLRAVVDAAPSALLAFADAGTITFTNAAARDLFFDGENVEGRNFLRMVERAPEALRRALVAEGDELFTLEGESGSETFHLSKRYLDDGGTLIAVNQLTEEVTRQEVATLKRVIRVITHELGNSLAPIKSLAGSARILAAQPERADRLGRIFDTIEERAAHLSSFLDGYARLARSPIPRRSTVVWESFSNGIRTLWPDLQVESVALRPGLFDAAQIEQVLINLIKNAREAGGDPSETRLEIRNPAEGGTSFTVLDRGAGMSDEVMRSALLPFFTTKPDGSGLGLALCRDIVDQHRGRLRLARRAGGGMAVSIWLPDAATATAGALSHSRVRLSLSRG